MADARFYVYEHIRPDTGEVFYVGKGNGRRAFCIDQRLENRHYCAVIRKLAGIGLCVKVEVVRKGLSEHDAFKLERRLIERIGRSDLGAGPLVNQSDGGEGSFGTLVSAKTRALLSKQRRGVPKSPEHRAKLAVHLRANGRSAANRARLAERNKIITIKGIPKSAEHRAKIGAAHKGVPKSIFQRLRLRLTLARKKEQARSMEI